MKKNLLLFAFIVASFSLSAKLNVQIHYDFGNVAYGDQLSNRPHLTATIENFTPDRCGSTYFFIDGNFGGNTMKSAYVEFAREFKFWKAPVAIHIEYNGGLSEMGGYDMLTAAQKQVASVIRSVTVADHAVTNGDLGSVGSADIAAAVFKLTGIVQRCTVSYITVIANGQAAAGLVDITAKALRNTADEL